MEKKYELPKEKLREYNEAQRKVNPFTPDFAISVIPFYEVCEFGYPLKTLLDALLKNANDHCTTTYYLLEKNHYTIR